MKIRGEGKTRRVWVDGQLLCPTPSQRLHNHSPDGFNWGYGGSGPSQLALAICLLIYPKEKAFEVYQDFKWQVISNLPMEEDFEVEIHEEKLKEVKNESINSSF
jgi:hypothetical protein